MKRKVTFRHYPGQRPHLPVKIEVEECQLAEVMTRISYGVASMSGLFGGVEIGRWLYKLGLHGLVSILVFIVVWVSMVVFVAKYENDVYAFWHRLSKTIDLYRGKKEEVAKIEK